MVAIHAQKRSATDSSDLLSDLGILQNVLSYVGLGHHLFVAPVSKWWREVYSTVESHDVTVTKRSRKGSRQKRLTCVRQMTLYSSVFASPPRLKLAHESGLGCSSRAFKFQLAAGRHAGIATLASAHELGMQYSARVLAGAALCNKLAEVQYLHERGCPWPMNHLEEIASRGYCELVRWCHERGCPWQDISKGPDCAAASGNVELMAWVLQLPGTQLSEAVMKAAASKGHRDVCKYLHEPLGLVCDSRSC
jgi:hypothetical protein